LTATDAAATDRTGPVVVLIGSPGAGKSSVGRRVAEALGVPFADTDQLVEAASGMSVSDIFITHGEDEFRRREAAAVAEALKAQSGVVSLGGGAVMREATRELLQGSRVVWLRVSLADAAHRVGMNTARPLLLGNVRATLSGMLEQRNPVYEAVATDIVDTSGRSVREVTEAIVGMVRGD
jgi:shikimate kinase